MVWRMVLFKRSSTVERRTSERQTSSPGMFQLQIIIKKVLF